jgi:hypothetical protein
VKPFGWNNTLWQTKEVVTIDKIMTEQTELESLNKDLMAIRIVLDEWVESGKFQEWFKNMRSWMSWIKWCERHSSWM